MQYYRLCHAKLCSNSVTRRLNPVHVRADESRFAAIYLSAFFTNARCRVKLRHDRFQTYLQGNTNAQAFTSRASISPVFGYRVLEGKRDRQECRREGLSPTESWFAFPWQILCPIPFMGSMGVGIHMPFWWEAESFGGNVKPFPALREKAGVEDRSEHFVKRRIEPIRKSSLAQASAPRAVSSNPSEQPL